MIKPWDPRTHNPSSPDAVPPPRRLQPKPLQDRSDPYGCCLQTQIYLSILAPCILWHSYCRGRCCCNRTWASLCHAVGPSTKI